jgi:small conductance mechanosensitive channel
MDLISGLIKVAVYFVLGYLIYFFSDKVLRRVIKGIIEKKYKEKEREVKEKTLLRIIDNSLKAFLIVIVVLTALPEFGINIGPLLASAGVVGLTISFASRSLIEDYITGFFIFIDDQVRIGDRIFIGPPIGLEGEVVDFNLRQITLKTENGEAIIRNSKIPFIVNKTKEKTKKPA